jgi:hypothetical protein
MEYSPTMQFLLVGIPEWLRARTILNDRISCFEGVKKDDPRRGLSDTTIQEYIASDLDRLRRIEDKGRNNLVGATLAVAVVAAGVKAASGGVLADHFFVGTLAGVSLCVAVLYLLVGGLFGLEAYRVGPVNRHDALDRPELTTPEDWMTVLLETLELNRKRITLKANSLFVSHRCLRNGLIFVGVFAVIAGGSIVARPTEEKTNDARNSTAVACGGEERTIQDETLWCAPDSACE